MQQQNKAREQQRAAHALRMREKKTSRERARSALDQHLEQTNRAVAELRDSLRASVQRQRPHASTAAIDAEVETQLHEVMRATAEGGEFRTGKGEVFFATDLREVMREIAPDGRDVSVEELHAALLRRVRADLCRHIPDADDSKIEEMVAAEGEKLRLDLMNIAAAERGINPAAACIDHDDATKAEGRERAERMKPEARELACGPALRHLPPAIIEALVNNDAGLDDVQHVLVYPAPEGSPPGWHGDVHFGRPLAPIAGAIGTKVAAPPQSPEEAEEIAFKLLVGIAALDAACADPFHPLHPRARHRVQELVMFASFEDRMLIDFPAIGDADYDVYRIGQPARGVERDDFLELVEEVFRKPGGCEKGQATGLAFVRHCRDNPAWFSELQEAARRRREWERLERVERRLEEPDDGPPASPEAVAEAAELMAAELLEQFRADFRSERPGLGDKALDALIRTMLRTLLGHKEAMALFLANMRSQFPTLPHGVDTGKFSRMMAEAALRQIDGEGEGGRDG